RLDADAGGVARVERAVGAQVADVVACMSRRSEALQADDALAGDVDVLLRDGGQLAPEVVKQVAVETAGTRFQPRWIDEMRCADLRYVHLQPRMLAHKHARGARVVEV